MRGKMVIMYFSQIEMALEEIKRYLGTRPYLRKILENTSWLLADRILRLGVGFFVGVWVARYLGPAQYGLLNYASALVGLFGSIATLGLNDIVVRDIVRTPDASEEILATGFALRVAGGFLGFILPVLAVLLIRPTDTLAKLLVVILGFSVFVNSANIIKCWFESQVQSKYIVWVENTVFLIISATKVFLILIGAPLLYFALVLSLEAVLVAFGLFLIYHRLHRGFLKWHVNLARARILLKESWPLALSSLAIMLYMRIDQVMLGQMVGNQVVGVYSAAVRICEVFYFIPTILASSLFPAIVKSKDLGGEIYHERLQKFFTLMVFLALSISIPVTILSKPIINLLLGTEYKGTALILATYTWAGVFVFLGVGSSIWFVNEHLQKFTFFRTILGAFSNVGLNLLFIPHYGALGAAIATIISQAIASFLANVVNRKTRPLFFMQAKALSLRWLPPRSIQE